MPPRPRYFYTISLWSPQTIRKTNMGRVLFRLDVKSMIRAFQLCLRSDWKDHRQIKGRPSPLRKFAKTYISRDGYITSDILDGDEPNLIVKRFVLSGVILLVNIFLPLTVFRRPLRGARYLSLQPQHPPKMTFMGDICSSLIRLKN